MKKSLLGVAAAFALLLPQLAQAQAWPQRPVRVVVPFPPGGTTDIQARIISERLASALGQQFVADNRPGAGGAIAAEIVERIAQEVARAVREPAMIERLNSMGVTPVGNTPAEFAELIRSEMPLWRAAVDAAGIKQE